MTCFRQPIVTGRHGSWVEVPQHLRLTCTSDSLWLSGQWSRIERVVSYSAMCQRCWNINGLAITTAHLQIRTVLSWSLFSMHYSDPAASYYYLLFGFLFWHVAMLSKVTVCFYQEEPFSDSLLMIHSQENEFVTQEVSFTSEVEGPQDKKRRLV